MKKVNTAVGNEDEKERHDYIKILFPTLPMNNI